MMRRAQKKSSMTTTIVAMTVRVHQKPCARAARHECEVHPEMPVISVSGAKIAAIEVSLRMVWLV